MDFDPNWLKQIIEQTGSTIFVQQIVVPRSLTRKVKVFVADKANITNITREIAALCNTIVSYGYICGNFGGGPEIWFQEAIERKLGIKVRSYEMG